MEPWFPSAIGPVIKDTTKRNKKKERKKDERKDRLKIAFLEDHKSKNMVCLCMILKNAVKLIINTY